MRIIPPIAITSAMLIASSVVETPPPLYVPGTTYAEHQTCAVGTVGLLLTVYESRQAGNLGNAPATSADWWLNIGTTYAVHSLSASYALGHRVIDPVAHLVYESVMTGTNTGKPLTLTTAWRKVGPTNRWMPFDDLRNTQAVTPVESFYTLAPVERVSSIAVIGLDASSITISVVVAGVEVYTVTVNLSTRRTLTLSGYFFGEFKYRRSVQFFDLPPYRNAQITVTTRKPSGSPAVGGIIIGNAVYIGDVQYSPVSDHLNFSVVKRDDFGGLELRPRRSVPTVKEEIWFDKSLTRTILDLREQLNGRPAILSGLDDFTDDYFEPLFLFAIIKQFALNLSHPDHGVITLEAEEL